MPETDLLIIVPPERSEATIYPPYGAMYICGALRKKGYIPAILNLDLERLSLDQTIDRIKEINPRYVGFSGIVATSYGIVKKLSHSLRHVFPQHKQILGGGLSAAWEPVLENTDIDIIVRGEGDETIIELLDHLKDERDISRVKGIVYRTGGHPSYTGRRRLVTPLDKLPYPDFDAVDFDSYLVDGVEFIHRFTTKIKDSRLCDGKRKGKRMITIPVSRGCFGRCTFCYRAYPGLRTHSYEYIFDFVEYCMDRFDVGFFTFGDECFAPSKKWNWEFLRELEKRRLDIVFRILGMRVDTVDREILKAFKEAGCWMIEYGFESGSQKILNIIDKRVSVEDNRQVALWTHDAGIYTSPALVLGMPGETSDTIGESIAFVNSLGLGFRQYQMAYAMPIPGAPLYDYAKLSGIISDEDAYLEMISAKSTDRPYCNLTQEPDTVLMSWADRVRREVDTDYLTRRLRSRILGRVAEIGFGKVYSLRNLYRQGALGQALRDKFKTLVDRGDTGVKAGQSILSKADLSLPGIDEVLGAVDQKKKNRNASLREYNRKVETLFKTKKDWELA
jgi:radical SAM superfamily enzyme YgiQ (UPF0313 family)